jgi:hypothetical protein
MWFRRHSINANWDPIAVRKRWRDSEVRGRTAFEKVFPQRPPRSDPNGFYDLCLAEFDALVELNRSQCFGSLSDFVAELRRIQSKPTAPSVPAFNRQVYEACQKQWLDFMIRSTTSEACEQRPGGKAFSLIVVAFAFLALGIFLMLRGREIGMLQWQVIGGFSLCFLFFGLLCKLIENRSRNENGKRPIAAIETLN